MVYCRNVKRTGERNPNMPNWCSTSLEIETGTERLAKKVSDKIESWCHECGVENGFGDSWLGNIAVNSNAFPKGYGHVR